MSLRFETERIDVMDRVSKMCWDRTYKDVRPHLHDALKMTVPDVPSVRNTFSVAVVWASRSGGLTRVSHPDDHPVAVARG